MASQATLAVVDQLARASVQLTAREFLERRPPVPPDEATQLETVGRPVKLLLLLAAAVVFGTWSLGSLGAMAWWLITGRGTGGRMVAAGAVAPRHYDFRAKARRASGPR